LGIYGKYLKGIFKIYNLFTLKDADMEQAIELAEGGNVDEKTIHKDLEDFRNFDLEDKWILKAWGVDVPLKFKKQWAELICKKMYLNAVN